MPDSTVPVRVFIGSSREGYEIAANLQALLERDGTCEVDLWDKAFAPSSFALPALIDAAKQVDFAVLIATGDDVTSSRGEESRAVRDNISLEFGLFAGIVGLDRTYLLAPEEVPKLPSDLAGLTRLQYRSRSDNKISAALTGAVVDLKDRVRILGPRSVPSLTSKPAPPEIAVELTLERISEVENALKEQRTKYSASAFYRVLRDGRWMRDLDATVRYLPAATRHQLKELWVASVDFTRSWDSSNLEVMRLQFVADQLAPADLTHILALPTSDLHGNRQDAGLAVFLSFLAEVRPELSSPDLLQRIESED